MLTPRRLAWAMLVLLVAIAVLRWLAPGGDEPSTGPRASSLATAPGGVAAWASVLDRAGHPVRRLRIPVDERAPDPRWTIVLLEPETLRQVEAKTLADALRRGARVVIAGEQAGGVLDALGVTGLTAMPGEDAAVLRPTIPVPETAGVARIDGDRAAYDAAAVVSGSGGPTALPLLSGPDGPAALAFDVGRGRLVALASAASLTNATLGRADNAAWALDLAGEPGRTVAFVESVHGFSRAAGLAALPGEVVVALVGLALATLLLALSRARRFGDPEERAHELPPPRRAYVEAVAASLLRTSDRARGGEPVRRAALDLLAARSALPAKPTADQVRLAAREAGLGDLEAEALASPGADLLTTGRAHHALSATRGAR